jgi:hypothetical protein
VDPDPHGSTNILVGWIRIRLGNADDSDPEAKKMTQKTEEIFLVLNCWMFSFEG